MVINRFDPSALFANSVLDALINGHNNDEELLSAAS